MIQYYNNTDTAFIGVASLAFATATMTLFAYRRAPAAAALEACGTPDTARKRASAISPSPRRLHRVLELPAVAFYTRIVCFFKNIVYMNREPGFI